MNDNSLRAVPFLQSLIPGATLLAAVVLIVLPLPIPYLGVVTPFLALATVYFWSVYRPELLPDWSVFLLGLLQDMLTGGPVGITALILLLGRALAFSQRRTLLGQTFGVEWAGFLLVSIGASACGWLAASAYNAAALQVEPFVVQALLTAALYPVWSWCLGQTARAARPVEAG